MAWALGIDVGTTAVKAAAVSAHGTVLAEAVTNLQIIHTPDGGFEQDPAAISRAILQVAADVSGEMLDHDDHGPCAGIQCAAQYSSIVPVDRHGTPLHNLLLWMDQRGAEYSRELLASASGSLHHWLNLHGLTPTPDGGDSLARVLWLRNTQPKIWARTRACLEPADFAGCVLTGRIASSPCTAFPLMLTDNRKSGHSPWAEELLQLTGLTREQLPELLAKDAVLGTLLPDVAQALGLTSDTPVFVGVNDTQAVQVGTGAVSPGLGGLSIGTTTVLACPLDSFRADYPNMLLPMPSAFSEDHTVMAENGMGGKAIEFAVERILNHKADANSWDQFAQLAQESPPGSGGAIYLPFVSGALAPVPSNQARAGFLNLHMQHDRRHLARAVLEGVAMNLHWLFGKVESFVGTPFNSLTLGGGAARIDGFGQLLADVLQRPIRQLDNPRAVASRGAGLLVFHRLGELSRLDLAGLGGAAELFLPNTSLGPLYRELGYHFVAMRHSTEQHSRAMRSLNLPLDFLEPDPS